MIKKLLTFLPILVFSCLASAETIAYKLKG